MKTAVPVLALVLAFAAAPLAATTFVMITDEALVDQTPMVVEALVLSADPSPAPGAPSTDYLIEVQRVLKGAVPGSNLIVRVRGGVGPDGIGLKIWGAPRFVPDERVVLFLHPGDDGTFRIAHLMLGAFHEARSGDETVLVRSLAEAREVPAPGESADARERYRLPRRREAFLQWIDRRAQGIEAAAGDYFFEPPAGGTGRIFDQFEVFRDGETGHRLRWFQFDAPNPQTALWVVNHNLQPGLTQNQLLGAITDGMTVWNNDAGSDVFYALDDPVTTTTTRGLGDRPDEYDEINSFQFEDPRNDIQGIFNCPGGGVLAIGGPWYNEVPESHDGALWHRIVGGDVVTNNGIGCFFNVANPRRLASELFGHELGHTLGLGHSCDDDGAPPCAGNPELDAALMNPILDSSQNRGPDLGSDDIAGIRHLYGNGLGGGPRPTAPSGLTAQLTNAATAVLHWSDNSNNETGFRVQERIGAGPFVALPDLPPGTTTTTVSNLLPQTTYTWRVRALGGNQHSPFSNQAMVTTPAPVPGAPSGLTATPTSPTVIDLAWEDNPSNETEFAIEVASPDETYHEIAVAPAGATGFAVGGRVTGRPYSFRVRARNATGASPPSNEASATTSADPTAPCVADGDTLCLLGGRFRVEVAWRNQFANGENGPGAVQPSPVGGTKTGVFSFFNPSNIELIVKALDARTVNGHFWLFYGALSTVEYWVTVTDTDTGDSKTYHNPPDELCGVGDNAAFPAPQPLVSQAAAPPVSRAAAPAAGVAAPLAVLPAAGGTSGTCVPDATTLCLGNGRFEITVDWTDPRTLDSGVGTAVPGSDLTGYFWFFNDQNVELVIKILDATDPNQFPDPAYWVFYGALSDVEYNIQVRDTVTGFEKPYHNEPLNICGQADTSALPPGP